MLTAAIDSFFQEFSKFEMPVMGTALRSLSKDAMFVEQAEKLLDLEARLTLLLRLSAARAVPSALAERLERIVSRARVLRAQRDTIAHHLRATRNEQRKPKSAAPPQIRVTRNRKSTYVRLAESHEVLLPTVAQIQAYADEAVELQDALSRIARTLDERLTPGD